jgi:FeS assembly SUF system regulator
MIRLSKLTDYGIALMVHMAREDGGRQMTARELSESTNVPLPTVSKLLKLLTQSGLLKSQRGVTGGYSLARQPESITIVNMIEALEGPMVLTDCVNDEECVCDLKTACGLSDNWGQINQKILSSLDNFTLKQMAGSLMPSQTPAS